MLLWTRSFVRKWNIRRVKICMVFVVKLSLTCIIFRSKIFSSVWWPFRTSIRHVTVQVWGCLGRLFVYSWNYTVAGIDGCSHSTMKQILSKLKTHCLLFTGKSDDLKSLFTSPVGFDPPIFSHLTSKNRTSPVGLH